MFPGRNTESAHKIKSNLCLFLCAELGFTYSQGSSCRGLTPSTSDQTPWCEMVVWTPQHRGPCAEMLLLALWLKMPARGPCAETLHLALRSGVAAAQVCQPGENPTPFPADRNHIQQHHGGLFGGNTGSRAWVCTPSCFDERLLNPHISQSTDAWVTPGRRPLFMSDSGGEVAEHGESKSSCAQ